MGSWSVAALVVLFSTIVVSINAESTTIHPSAIREVDVASSRQPLVDHPGLATDELQSGNSTVIVNQTAPLDSNENFPNEAKHSLNEEINAEESRQKSAASLRERLFFGSFRTQTHIIVTFSTTTVPQFCLLGTAEAACMVGRRKRRRSVPIALIGSEMQDEIESSLSVAGSGGDVRSVNDGGRKFFTVWTKFLTTTTLTTTATNTASTISLSYYCTAGSISLPPNCG